MFRLQIVSLTTVASCLVIAPSARAYVDLAPTLGRIVRESQTISVAEVARFNPDRGAVILKKIRDLKGETESEPIKQQLIRGGDSVVDWPILDWAEPGRRCVIFMTGKAAIVCLGEVWFQAHLADDGWWRMGVARPDLPLAYYGSVSRLVDAIPLILAGKNAIITALPHGMDREGASFDLALNRASLPGLVKVQRLRASKRMPDAAMGVGSNPAFVVGTGRVGKEELPTLRKRLVDADASVRAEVATEIGFLNADGSPAADELVKLLDDKVASVRLAAASALLRVTANGSNGSDAKAIAVLAKGLASDDAMTRRQAARFTGLAGTAAASLAKPLGALLTDDDSVVRRTALQAVATLGPAVSGAVERVMSLLDQPETALDAAEALGRIGPAASPALKRLADLLDAEAPAQRWAAMRAMAQIGGAEAAPAVDYIMRQLPKAPEIEGYNMLIYLALLGPVAEKAVPTVRSSRVRNPVLRQITAWAIAPAADLPQIGPLGDVEFVQYIFESFVRELGDHLRPRVKSLAQKIMAGSAGNVPAWGYKLLARFPEDALAILTPGLADEGLVVRERATVALGYMGHAAAGARQQVARALKSSSDEREQLLLQWCLRELE